MRKQKPILARMCKECGARYIPNGKFSRLCLLCRLDKLELVRKKIKQAQPKVNLARKINKLLTMKDILK